MLRTFLTIALVSLASNASAHAGHIAYTNGHDHLFIAAAVIAVAGIAAFLKNKQSRNV